MRKLYRESIARTRAVDPAKRAALGTLTLIAAVCLSMACEMVSAEPRDITDGMATKPLWRCDVNSEFPAGGHTLEGGIPSASISDDGSMVAVCLGEYVELYESRSGRLLRRFGPHPYRTFIVAWSPDGALLAVTTFSETLFPALGDTRERTYRQDNAEYRHQSQVYLWQVADGESRARCAGHRGQVVAMTFSPNSQRVLSTGIDESIRLWDVSNGREVAVFETDEGTSARRAGFSVDPAFLVTAEHNEVVIRDAANGWNCLMSGVGTVGTVPIAVSAQGKIAVCSEEFSRDVAYNALAADAEGRKALSQLPMFRHASRQLMYLQLRSDPYWTVQPVKPPSGKRYSIDGWMVADRSSNFLPAPIISPDGKRLCISRIRSAGITLAGELTFWNAETWELEWTKSDCDGSNDRFAFSPDSRYLEVGGLDWVDLETRETMHPAGFEDSQRWNRTEFSKDGKCVLTIMDDIGAEFDRRLGVQLWDRKALQKILVKKLPDGN